MPHQPGPTTETRQISQDYLSAVLDPGTAAAAVTPRTVPGLFDMNHQRLARHILNAQDLHLGQTHQQLTHATRVRFQQGLSRIDGLDTPILEVPAPRLVDPPQPKLTPRLFPKRPNTDPAQQSHRTVILEVFATGLIVPG